MFHAPAVDHRRFAHRFLTDRRNGTVMDILEECITGIGSRPFDNRNIIRIEIPAEGFDRQEVFDTPRAIPRGYRAGLLETVPVMLESIFFRNQTANMRQVLRDGSCADAFFSLLIWMPPFMPCQYFRSFII
jgi:hypothetical protein